LSSTIISSLSPFVKDIPIIDRFIPIAPIFIWWEALVVAAAFQILSFVYYSFVDKYITKDPKAQLDASGDIQAINGENMSQSNKSFWRSLWSHFTFWALAKTVTFSAMLVLGLLFAPHYIAPIPFAEAIKATLEFVCYITGLANDPAKNSNTNTQKLGPLTRLDDFLSNKEGEIYSGVKKVATKAITYIFPTDGVSHTPIS
jgi:hypothetical protein